MLPEIKVNTNDHEVMISSYGIYKFYSEHLSTYHATGIPYKKVHELVVLLHQAMCLLLLFSLDANSIMLSFQLS